MWLKMELQIYEKMDIFFQHSWNLFCIIMESKADYFLLFIVLCLVRLWKCLKLFAITWVTTTLWPPCVLVSACTVLIMHQCLVVADLSVLLTNGGTPSLSGVESLPWWHSGRELTTVQQHRLCWPLAACRPWMLCSVLLFPNFI